MERNKMLVLVLVVALLIGSVMNVAADSRREPVSETVINPRMSYINHVGVSLSIDKNGKATINASMGCYQNVSSCILEIELQVYKDGYWQSVKTWYAYGTYTTSFYQEYYVARGYTYRVRATGHAYVNGRDVEQGTIYSNEVDYF